jgi:aspartate carbamoyltransferase catalytic subunit
MSYYNHIRMKSLNIFDCISVNLGVELSEEVAHCKQSLILDQVTNGVAVRMSVLYLVGSVQKETDS